MRVVQINTVYKNGGSTGRIVYDLKSLCSSEGIDSYVAYGYEYSHTDDNNTFLMESIPELKLNILKTRLFAHHGFYNKNQTSRLLHWLDEIKPDIIHLHNIHNHYVNVEMLFDYIKEKNIPVIWTLHDCWSFTGWCAYFDYAECYKWKTGCGNCPNKHSYPFTWFFDRSKKNYVDKKRVFTGVKQLIIVPPSEWLKELVLQSFLSDYPVKVINNGIDLSIFKPTPSDFKKSLNIGNKKILLSVAMGFSKRKGIEHIFKLSEMINPDEAVIVIVGLSKKQISLLPEGIIGIPKTNSTEELAAIYSSADVFINPTLEDNYPTTNLEAIACGTPVVTYNTGGSPESIFNGCGVVVPKGDLNKFFETVCKVLKQGKNPNHCVEIARNNFDKNICFQEYIKLYRRVGE